MRAIDYAYEAGELHGSANRGIITSIPKKGRDSRRLVHLRPISLLNVDFKLIEKMMANRIKPMLDKIIHMDQKGFLAKRRISSNIRCILDIMDKLEKEDDSGIIVSVDYQKAFDRVEIESLLGAIAFFGFGEYVYNWTQIFYRNATSYVVNNGMISKPFNVTRGVRQGAPCSAYYFLICAELLAIQLRKNEQIEGFKIGDFKKLFGQYADDMDLYCKDKENNLKIIMQILKDFCANTGLKVNYDKTSLYRIGKPKDDKSNASNYTIGNMRLIKDKINVLGVWVCKGKEALIEEIY